MDDDFVYIDENHRLGYGYDESAENPREDWDMMTGFVTIETRRPHYIDVTAVHDDPTGRIAEAHEHFEGAAWYYPPESRSSAVRKRFYPAPEEITVRWARIFHNLHIEWDGEYRGYWFVDPDAFAANWTPGPDGLIQRWDYPNGVPTPMELETVEAVQKEVIKGERATYRAWAEGEVYYVYAETRRFEHVVVADGAGRTLREYDRDDWETTDSLHGIYQDGYGETFEDMVQSVAKENFGDEYTAA